MSKTCSLNRSCPILAGMRALLATITAGAFLWIGCAGHRGGSSGFGELPPSRTNSISLPDDRLTITSDHVLVGKVLRVNQEGRFVVMSFPIGRLPVMGQRLNIYHHGQKAGEIRATGPQLDDSVVGDIAEGNAQAGDEVRAQ